MHRVVDSDRRPLKPLLDLEPELGIVSDVVAAATQAEASDAHGDAEAAAMSQEPSQGQEGAVGAGSAGTASGAEGDVQLPVLEAMYAVPEPKSLPAGALEEDDEEEAGTGGLEGVPEEGEEGEGAAGAGQGPKAKAKGPAPGKARVPRTRARK